MLKLITSSDGVLKFKLLTLIGYLVVMVSLIVYTGSDQDLIDQLILQSGGVIKDLIPLINKG